MTPADAISLNCGDTVRIVSNKSIATIISKHVAQKSGDAPVTVVFEVSGHHLPLKPSQIEKVVPDPPAGLSLSQATSIPIGHRVRIRRDVSNNMMPGLLAKAGSLGIVLAVMTKRDVSGEAATVSVSIRDYSHTFELADLELA